MKTCSKCQRTLPESEFGRNRANPDDLQYWCKECGAEYQREYWQDPGRRERRREYMREYNRRPEVRAKRRNRRTKYSRDREKARNQANRRRALKQGAAAPLTTAEWREILMEWDWRCAYCGISELDLWKAHVAGNRTLHQEHVIPLDQGGEHTKENVVPACWRCNFSKGAHTPEEAGLRLMTELKKNEGEVWAAIRESLRQAFLAQMDAEVAR